MTQSPYCILNLTKSIHYKAFALSIDWIMIVTHNLILAVEKIQLNNFHGKNFRSISENEVKPTRMCLYAAWHSLDKR